MDEATRRPATTPAIAGRAEELARLGSAVDAAARGRPSAVFVHGEAGVGKTRLVRAVADAAAARGFAVLWGACLRFGAVESVLLPWVVALDGWLATASEEERRAVLAEVPDAGRLLPSLGGAAQDGATQLMQVAEALLARVVARHPTLLVLDDVQWADAASRDAVSYAVAGFARQRLLVLGTCRDEGLPTGDPTYGWLADLRRLPQVSELVLDRLARGETEEQVTTLLGTAPTPALVDAVQQRSAGNPYLTELLVQHLDPAAEHLPHGLPTDLATALLAAWHRLSPDCRTVVRVLAVAGRPVPMQRLVGVCAATGLEADDAQRAVTEAAGAGPLVTVDGALWLRHPLLAEVLYETYLPGEVEPVHRAWAESLEAEGERDGVEELRRLGDLALHREHAGDVDEAFVASLAAADHARRLRIWRDEAVHLQRAARLWPSVHTGSRDGLDETELLERAAVASSRVGQDLEGVELARRALALALQSGDRLRASRLTIRVASTDWWLGESDDEAQSDHAQTAVDLAAGQPHSREHADALTYLADALMWEGRWRRAIEVADAAVAAARRSGSTEALAEALGTRSAIPFRPDGGRADSQEGLRLAVSCGDPDVVQWAAQWRMNVLIAHGRLREALEVSTWVLDQSLESGALGSALWHASGAAGLLADAGRLEEAAATVRTGLGLMGVGNGAAALRLAAMVTAVRRGDLTAARLHLERAREQIPRLEIRPGLEAPPKIAELLLAEGRAEDAVRLLVSTTQAQSIDARVTDLMLLWGVRAAADLAVRARDRRDRRGARRARRALQLVAWARDDIGDGERHVGGRVLTDPFTGPDPRDPVLEAWRRLRDAEVARFDGSPDEPDRWAAAVRCCRIAGLQWDAAGATLRWCQAMLGDGAARERVAGPLRDAHAYAVREGAQRLAAEVEALATSARVPLVAVTPAPAVPSQRHGEAGPLATLTRREREVLDHLVAGRTYAEIARALFISDKTVSAHVSNVLRKTGTSSRHEVSALVLRTSAAVR